MALIDATARFAARREAARHQDGRFGEQEHSAPEIGLVTEATPLPYAQLFDQWKAEGGSDLTADDAIQILAADTAEEQDRVRREWSAWLSAQAQAPSLEQIFEEMNELGELDDAAAVLAAPTVDTYTGSPEERENQRRNRELNSLLTRAGIERDDLNEDVLAQIQDGMHREEQQKKSMAEHAARRALLAETDDSLPEPRTELDRTIRAGVTAIIEARGYTLDDYSRDGVEYMERWARSQAHDENFAELIAAEAERSLAERLEEERIDRQNQDARLGPLTDDVWDEALQEDGLRAQQQIRKYRPTKYVSLKDTNVAIRADLKQAFGKAKFSVVGDSYSGGASTTVRYVDGPPEDKVKEIVEGYAGASFDGMTDTQSYHSVAGFDENGVPLDTHYGANYVFTSREFSDDVKQEAEAFLIKAFQDEGVTFDPTQRNASFQIPQAIYARATEENGGQRAGGSGYNFRSAYDHYAGELVAIASTLIANERWAAQGK